MTADEWIENRAIKDEEKPRPKSPPVVLVCKTSRKLLRVLSGKKVWPSVGAAKNAIRNDLDGWGTYHNRETLYQEILTKIEFVPLTETH